MGAAFARWRRWSEILQGAPVRTERPGTGEVEVHLLCHRGDYLCAVWALKTLYLTSAGRWPLVVHLQGSPTASMIRRLRSHFPDAQLVGQREADEKVTRTLSSGYPRLLAARRDSPFMLKLVDSTIFAGAKTVLMLDSDVLFFRAPHQLVAFVEAGAQDEYLFQRDPVSTYNITKEEAASAFGIQLPECVNTGIAAFPPSLVDFTLCERLLGHSDVRRLTGWIEQTLFALCAGARGRVKYLSSDYLISLERGLDYGAMTARHYAGPSRPLLTEEGMPYAAGLGVLGHT